MINKITMSKCAYRPLEQVELVIDSSSSQKAEIRVFHLSEQIGVVSCELQNGKNKVSLGTYPIGGYSLELDHLSTAFDVVLKLTDVPRYGFVSNFTTIDEDHETMFEQLNDYHLTTIQFYDWMYRHDDLINEEPIYADFFGREISNKILKDKIRLCHQYGMFAVAYGAIYGAESDYFSKHMDELMYRTDGKFFALIDQIGMMDISIDHSWSKHIIEEFKKAITIKDFDGIHLDQYGFPKYSKRINGELIDFEKELPGFINLVLEELKGLKKELFIDFNYVNNWPIETISESKQDVVYIEVWNPNNTYEDLRRIITESKLRSQNRPLVLAAYLPPFKDPQDPKVAENGALLMHAICSSLGAYNLLYGEYNGILSNAYYVDYKKYSPAFSQQVKQYLDFIVKYSELLYSDKIDLSYTSFGGYDGTNTDFYINKPTSIKAEPGYLYAILGKSIEYSLINLINLSNQKESVWYDSKETPEPVLNTTIRILNTRRIKEVYLASPDEHHGKMVKVDHRIVPHEHGEAVEFTIDKIQYWTMVYMKYES
jgi:dextranase